MLKVIKRFSIGLVLAANICIILMLWLCVGLTFVSPDAMPRLSLLTLLFPIFLIADLCFIILWLLFRSRLVLVPIASVLLVAGYVLDYCPLHFLAGSSEAADSTLTIISFNVGYMKNDEQREELIRFINTSDADIVCLQELSKTFIKTHQEWIDSTGYQYLQSGSEAVLSRYPFLSDTIHISYPTRSNHSMACWIDCLGDSVLVINNHLESNKLSPEEKDEYSSDVRHPGGNMPV